MAARSGAVVSFPLYDHVAHEPLAHTAQRYLAIIKRMDPDLQKASVQGWNALSSVGMYLGMALTATGMQISEAFSLLDTPEQWRDRLDVALAHYPTEFAETYTYWTRQYVELNHNQQQMQTAALRAKIAQIVLDPTTKAMFAAASCGIDWDEVVQGRLCVCFDFSQEPSQELRRLKLLWVFHAFLAYVKERGTSQTHRPISLVVDELASMYRMGSDSFADDMDELINVIARNHNLWLCLAHQENYQFDARTVKTLMSMAVQILGSTEDPVTALQYAARLYRFNPRLIKRMVNVWGSVSYPMQGSEPIVLEQNPVEYTAEEQLLIDSYRYMDQGYGQFLVKVPGREVQRMSIAQLDRDIWVNEEGVAQVKRLLARRTGQVVDEVLAEIAIRQQSLIAGPSHVHSAAPPPPATMKTYDADHPYLPVSLDDEDDTFR